MCVTVCTNRISISLTRHETVNGRLICKIDEINEDFWRESTFQHLFLTRLGSTRENLANPTDVTRLLL